MMRKRLVLAALLGAYLSGAVPVMAMSVTGGLVPQQVVQCDDAGLAALTAEGVCGEGAGAVSARVREGDTVVVDWQEAGNAAEGAWSGTITGVPVGGPYVVEWRFGGETAAVSPVLVGDLWVLAGQSNMQGVGNLDNRVLPPHPLVKVFGMDRAWRESSEPIHILAESPDAVHFKAESEAQRQQAIKGARSGNKGATLAMAFAYEMLERTDRPIGFVATAHGGTSMDQWDPAKKDAGGDSLYGSMIMSIEGAGGDVRGVLWYQGESDAQGAPEAFKAKFERFIAAVREDTGKPGLPFLYVQIGRFPYPDANAHGWEIVRQAQLDVEAEVDNAALVTAIDVELDDLIHAGTSGLNALGRRLAHLAEAVVFDADNTAGPRLAGMERVDTPYGPQLVLTFSGVNGKLAAAGRPNGFAVTTGADGEDAHVIYDIELHPDAPDKLILWVREFPQDGMLWYGRGIDPYCNVTDTADMALPAFGPVTIP